MELLASSSVVYIANAYLKQIKYYMWVFKIINIISHLFNIVLHSPSVPTGKINHETKLEQFPRLAEQRHQSVLEAIVWYATNEYLQSKGI